jgi:hypothetical protein
MYDVRVADCPVCPGHAAPLDFVAAWVYDRPSWSVVLGPRGGGKSFLRAFATHVDSLRYDRHGTKILGGSEAQSAQIYDALKWLGAKQFAEADLMPELTATRASYSTGSEVSFIAASAKSVRGPHVASLCLDEVDEIDPEIREAAMGMNMAIDGVRASVSMTSTWHRVGGPMAGLIDRAQGGDFPLWSFCAFEVLERCPAERSGPPCDGVDSHGPVHYEHCPACPIRKWCHQADGPPKAKRSSGHYAIDSLIQKVQTVSLRIFEADYLCLGPRADGVWFAEFADAYPFVDLSAEYDPALPVHLAVDSGVHTGAVFFQVRPDRAAVSVFGDYYAVGLSAEANARAILEAAGSLCNGRLDKRVTDPAGGARNPVGPTVLAEYQRAGLPLDRWPLRSVGDGLALVESFLKSADGTVGLTIHPRCRHLRNALLSYRRAKRSLQWQDYPEDPQHPAEELVDSLRGGLCDRFPEGRRPEPKLRRVPYRKLF